MEMFNGVDLSALTPQMPARVFPAEVSGRVVHIDADFLAYMVSYEKPNTQIELKDMQHNAQVAIEKMRRMAGAQGVMLHLTPSLSTKGGRIWQGIQREYQGNRKDKEKPEKLSVIRTWLASAFPAQSHLECEADDGMSSEQYAAIANGARDLSVICSKDKDLNMVPGLHMDWDTGEIVDSGTDFGEIHLVEQGSSKKLKGYGQKFFWAQMLMGDTADNVQGLPFLWTSTMSKPKKVGPAITYSLLCDINNSKEAFTYIKSLYEAAAQYAPFKHWQSGEEVPWQSVFLSEMKMLWMRREKHNENCVLTWLKEVNS